MCVMAIPPGRRIRAISCAASHGRSMCSNTSEEKTTSNDSSGMTSAQSVMSAMIVFGMSEATRFRS